MIFIEDTRKSAEYEIDGGTDDKWAEELGNDHARKRWEKIEMLREKGNVDYVEYSLCKKESCR